MGCTRISVSLVYTRRFPELILLVSGTFTEEQSILYFDRKDVKEAIHAPVNVDWVECTNTNVFPNGDASLPPVFTVLPGVIEKSKRSVIIHGLGDFILIADGWVLILPYPDELLNCVF